MKVQCVLILSICLLLFLAPALRQSDVGTREVGKDLEPKDPKIILANYCMDRKNDISNFLGSFYWVTPQESGVYLSHGY